MFGSILTYRGIDLVTSAVSGSADAENTSTNTGGSTTSFAWTGQSWTSPSSPSALTGIRLQLSKSGVAPVGLVRVAVYAESSDLPTGASLVASPFYAVDGLTTVTDYYFPLSGWTPAASTKYVFLLEPYNVFSYIDSFVSWRSNTTSTYAGGVQVRPLDSIPPDEDRYASQISAAVGSAGTSELQFTVYSVNGSGSGSGDPVVSCTSATGTKLSEFVPADDTSGAFVGHARTSAYTTFNSGSAASISGVCLRLYKEGTPTGTFKVSIRASTTFGPTIYEPTGADLAVTSAYDMSTVTGGGESFAADYWFALPFTPSPDTFYTIVVEEQGDFVGDTNNTMVLVIDQEPENATNGGFSADYGTSWGAYASADGGHKVYGTSAVEENPLTSIDFGTRTVVTISNTLSADETDALKVDVSQLSPEEGTGRPVREVYIEQIKAITSGVDVDILWDATSPEHCLSISDDSGIDWDFRAVGPLTNNAGAGKTGNILFSTNGASAGSSYSVTLVMRKKY